MNRPLNAAVALFVLIAAGLVTAQQRFTSHAEAVRVDVLVTRGNKLVSGLKAADFELRDSAVPQRVELIEVERLPLNLMLVLDTSGSVAGRPLAYLLDAGRAVLNGLRDGDRVALISFATRVRLLAPLTSSREQILTAFHTMTGEGSTPLHEAAFAALALREADPGRTLMILFSDGKDTSSWLTDGKVIETAKHSDVVIYPVGIQERFNLGRKKVTFVEAGQFLESLADVTGGRVMLAGADADLRDTFVKTLAEFRDRYVLTYQPTGVPAGGWHPIEVQLKGRSGKITARRGYFAQ